MLEKQEHRGKLRSSQAYKTPVGIAAVCADHATHVFYLQILIFCGNQHHSG